MPKDLVQIKWWGLSEACTGFWCRFNFSLLIEWEQKYIFLTQICFSEWNEYLFKVINLFCVEKISNLKCPWIECVKPILFMYIRYLYAGFKLQNNLWILFSYCEFIKFISQKKKWCKAFWYKKYLKFVLCNISFFLRPLWFHSTGKKADYDTEAHLSLLQYNFYWVFNKKNKAL